MSDQLLVTADALLILHPLPKYSGVFAATGDPGTPTIYFSQLIRVFGDRRLPGVPPVACPQLHSPPKPISGPLDVAISRGNQLKWRLHAVVSIFLMFLIQIVQMRLVGMLSFTVIYARSTAFLNATH